MSITMMTGIALIVAMALWFISIDFPKIFDVVKIFVTILAAAWAIAFVIETNVEQRRTECRIWPEECNR